MSYKRERTTTVTMSATKTASTKKTKTPKPAPVEAPVVEAPVIETPPAQEGGAAAEEAHKNKRHFTLMDVREGGPDGKQVEFDAHKRFAGTSPSGAARKAAYQIFDKLYGKSKDSVSALVSVREIPRGRQKKEVLEAALAKAKVYSYLLTRTSTDDREPAKFGKAEDGSPKTTVTFPYTMSVRAYRPDKKAPEEPATMAHAE